MPLRHTERATIFEVSTRSRYLLAIRRTSSSRPSERVVGLRPERQETLVLHDEVVLRRFLAGVRQHHDFCPRELRDQRCQVPHLVDFGRLVEHRHPLTLPREGC